MKVLTNCNDLNWSTKSFWHCKPQNVVKETWGYAFFGPVFTMVLVTSFWTNSLSKKAEPVFWLQKISFGVPQHSILGDVPYLC